MEDGANEVDQEVFSYCPDTLELVLCMKGGILIYANDSAYFSVAILANFIIILGNIALFEIRNYPIYFIIYY